MIYSLQAALEKDEQIEKLKKELEKVHVSLQLGAHRFLIVKSWVLSTYCLIYIMKKVK